jgi:hypothetical protein
MVELRNTPYIDFKQDYEREFSGMTREPISYDWLLEIQQTLATRL